MRRVLFLVALVAALMPAAPVRADRLQTGIEQLRRMGANNCRNLGLDDACSVADGRKAGDAHMRAYEQTWVHRALTLQRRLGDDVALLRSLLPHTHNSFNASVYAPPTVTNQDPNQIYSMTDQLRMDIRAIEMDVHWVPSIWGDRSTGYRAVTLCHGEPIGGVHLGCSDDPPLRHGLHELKAWMEQPENRRDFVLLYLENNLDGDATAHRLATDDIRRVLGDLVARPPAGQRCAPIDGSLTPAELRAAGHRVLIVGNCGPGAWGSWVWERGTAATWVESGSGPGDDYPGLRGCARERVRTGAAHALVRWYEDSTWLTAFADGERGVLTPREAAAMAACGANQIGFDQLTPEDPRLAAIVWSWARNEPRDSSACAAQGADGRWMTQPCAANLAYACQLRPDEWRVTRAVGPSNTGAAACAREFPGSRFGPPRNGWENGLLLAQGAARSVWLGLSKDLLQL